MKSNFQQFAAIGRPWVTEGDYVREEQDAANPLCSTARRRSARDYVEIRKHEKKSHNMCFSDERGPAREQSQTARVLAIRNRLKATPPEKAALAAWQAEQRVFVPKTEPEAEAKREAKPRLYAVDRQYLSQFRRVLNLALRAYVIHRYYSEIVHFYGSVSVYLGDD